MSKQVALAAQPRAGAGKGEARRLRREGRVPAVAYGVGLDPTPISVDARELYHALHTDAGRNAIIRIDVAGDTHLALAREIQTHPVRREVVHVDFVAVDRNVPVAVDVPLHIEGEAPGVQDGGIVTIDLHTLHVQAPPLEVPDMLAVDISDLAVGDVRRAGDVALPAGVELLDDPERVVVSITLPTLEDAEVTETAETEDEAALKAGGATAEEAAG